MNPLRGIAMKLVSVTLFMTMSGLIKLASDRVPTGEIVFFRSFFAMPVIVIWLYARKELSRGLRPSSFWGHVLRGLLGTGAMGLSFAALGLLPLPEVTAIGYAGPLLAVVFAAVLLGEEVRAFRISAVVLGLVGVLVVLAPDLGDALQGRLDRTAGLGVAAALLGAVCWGFAQVWLRRFVMVEKVSAIVFYFSLCSTLLSFVTLPFGWVVPTAGDAAALVLAGVFGGAAQILLTSSYRHADASVIAPFEYASMLLALGIGYFAFAEVPDWTTLGGAGLVVFAGLLIIWREHRLGIERSRARRATTPATH